MADAHKAKVICLAQSKGGTSKTSSTLNIGAALHHLGYRVLLVDVDQQSNLTIGLGGEPTTASNHRHFTTYDLLTDPGLAAKDALTSTEEGPDLLPASIDLAVLDRAIPQDIGREEILAKKLASLITSYDYILIDTPPSFEITTINGITAADYVLVPFLPEQYCLAGLAQVASKLEAIQENLNPSVKLLGVFITLYDGRVSAHREFSQIVRADWGERVFDTVIRRRANINNATAQGRSVVSLEPSSDLAKDYQNLTQEIISRATHQQ